MKRSAMLTDKGPLTPFAQGVWLSTEPVRFLGLKLTATMAVVRLSDGNLLVYSPVALTPERRASVEALGKVLHLYAPNLFHHLWVGEWASAFPSATLHAPRGLSEKRPDLHIHRIHGATPEPALSGIDELPVSGFRLQEGTLFYEPARTLIVADLVHNIGRPDHRWTKFYTRMMGFYDCVALSRFIRWTAFSDRVAARRSLNEILKRPFERMVVGHGAPITEGAHEKLSGSYAWLLENT